MDKKEALLTCEFRSCLQFPPLISYLIDSLIHRQFNLVASNQSVMNGDCAWHPHASRASYLSLLPSLFIGSSIRNIATSQRSDGRARPTGLIVPGFINPKAMHRSIYAPGLRKDLNKIASIPGLHCTSLLLSATAWMRVWDSVAGKSPKRIIELCCMLPSQARARSYRLGLFGGFSFLNRAGAWARVNFRGVLPLRECDHPAVLNVRGVDPQEMNIDATADPRWFQDSNTDSFQAPSHMAALQVYPVAGAGSTRTPARCGDGAATSKDEGKDAGEANAGVVASRRYCSVSMKLRPERDRLAVRAVEVVLACLSICVPVAQSKHAMHTAREAERSHFVHWCWTHEHLPVMQQRYLTAGICVGHPSSFAPAPALALVSFLRNAATASAARAVGLPIAAVETRSSSPLHSRCRSA
ncbi:hypothetical protein EVG20_g10341 [Dentipellis fragilis]|uniref:Uncharacterized protein n=1 Tax=Dentipellis fragilis TaxID=205917 RepID=A0A4Y9XRH3_9AGAM|nr:hypothetical protein EVG20_g10341 [Dentipellis fragilis]